MSSVGHNKKHYCHILKASDPSSLTKVTSYHSNFSARTDFKEYKCKFGIKPLDWPVFIPSFTIISEFTVLPMVVRMTENAA